MAPAGYSWYVGTLRDGLITTRVPLIQTSWSDVMDDAGLLTGKLPLADPDVAAKNPYLTAEPCRCFLAVSYTDSGGSEKFLAGGPIWTHNYDGNTQVLDIGAAGLWSYYDHRKVLPVLAAGVNPATVTTTYTSSLGTIAKRLVQLAHTHTGGAVPVVFPADEAGTNVRTYPGFDLSDVGPMLRDLTGVEGGPEIQFNPRRRAADPRYIEWVMRAGTTAHPLLDQGGTDWIWDTSVSKSSVSSTSVQRDGAGVGQRAWVKGTGTEVGTLIARADSTALIDAGFPLLEVQDTGHESVELQPTLDAYARGLLARSQQPTDTWTVKVRRDDFPPVGSYHPGDWVSIMVGPGPYLPQGLYRTRILTITGDDSLDVALQLAPTLEGS